MLDTSEEVLTCRIKNFEKKVEAEFGGTTGKTWSEAR
jgi:hypothetical protein